MAGQLPSAAFWNGRNVLITGHTGFIGSWLSTSLSLLGARVTGISLPPDELSHYAILKPQIKSMTSHYTDISDRGELEKRVAQAKPEIVFHLAAKSLVRNAYNAPVESFAVNTLGTVHVLEALRNAESFKAAIVMTTDKVYFNRETPSPYRESDTLGGREPYGASKACAEFVCEAYRTSYFIPRERGLATVRAGNVIGGGDFAPERLVPDFVRAAASGNSLPLRHPHARRPWQFIMELVRACLMLAEKLYAEPLRFARPWNIGPDSADNSSVSDLMESLSRLWGGGAPAIRHEHQPSEPYEASLLAIDSTASHELLGWQPAYPFSQGLKATCEWYQSYLSGGDPVACTLRHIEEWLHA